MSNPTGRKALTFPTDNEHYYLGGYIAGVENKLIYGQARFHVIENATKKEYEFTGNEMIQWFKDILKTTLKTAVMARTFIRVI